MVRVLVDDMVLEAQPDVDEQFSVASTRRG